MKKLLKVILITGILLITVCSISLAGCKQPAAETTAAETTAAETTAAETTAAETTAAETTASPEGQAYKIGFVCKLLTNGWFVVEVQGMQKFCDEKGIELIAVDANMDDEKCLALFDELITKGVDAIITSATSMGMGPAIDAKCKAAGIPCITIDDPLKDADGKAFPHVGMPTKEVGITGGEALAQLANERGFFDEGNVVKVLHGIVEKITVCNERADGFKQGLMENTPLKEDSFINVETVDGFMDNAIKGYSAVVGANLDATHWISYGCNDDSAVGAIRVYEELGIEKTNYLSCGLGGFNIALEELAKGNDSFITVGLRPDIEGYKACEAVYNFLSEGTPFEENIFVGGDIVTVDNYLDSPLYPYFMPEQ